MVLWAVDLVMENKEIPWFSQHRKTRIDRSPSSDGLLYNFWSFEKVYSSTFDCAAFYGEGIRSLYVKKAPPLLQIRDWKGGPFLINRPFLKTQKYPQNFFRLRRAFLTVEMTPKSTVLAPQAKNFSACGTPQRSKMYFYTFSVVENTRNPQKFSPAAGWFIKKAPPFYRSGTERGGLS